MFKRSVQKFNTRRSIRCLVGAVAAAALFVGSPATVSGFAGEDFKEGNPWHHEEITELAAKEAGFTQDALEELGWHADYIDSYLYNPFWWLEDGLDRFKVSLSTHDEMIKVHFDDLFSGDQVRRQWRRYLSGTIAGLMWAKEKNDVSAARNIVGISLHAIQDFYSHSNWVDAKDRRTRTWFEVFESERDDWPLWTGAYEHPEHLGVRHHGKINPACTALKNPAMSGMLSLGCAGISPLSGSSLCQEWKACKDGVAIENGQVLGVPIPTAVLYQAPPGIALDNTWLAEIGVKQRGLTDVTGKEIFDIAKGLALRSSIHWLKTIEEVMNKKEVGGKDFWAKVKSLKTSEEAHWQPQFENYNKFPYMFISAGTYPTALNTPEDEYYLRVRLKTANEADAGTDANIVLWAGSNKTLLDYMPGANFALAYNDFEQNDDVAYMAGPFTTMPTSIRLENKAPDAGKVLEALGRDFIDAMESLGESIGDFFMSLIGGHADNISNKRIIWTPEQLSQIGSSWKAFSVDLNGGDEGHYRVRGSIRKTKDNSGPNRAENWSEFSVRLDGLDCIAESDWDRGSNSDEPFLLALLVPLPGNVQKYRTEPFNDVDDEETRGIGHTFATVRIPKEYGMLSLPLSLLESDDESYTTRSELLNEFANITHNGTSIYRQSFVDNLSQAIGGDWKLREMEVYAFSKGGTVRAGTVFNSAVNTWIEGGESKTFNLNPAGLKTYPVHAKDLDEARITLPGGPIVIPSPTPDPNPRPTPRPLPGDISGEGTLDIRDVNLILRAVVTGGRLTDAERAAADMNNDGKVDVADATLALRKLVGL